MLDTDAPVGSIVTSFSQRSFSSDYKFCQMTQRNCQQRRQKAQKLGKGEGEEDGKRTIDLNVGMFRIDAHVFCCRTLEMGLWWC